MQLSCKSCNASFTFNGESIAELGLCGESGVECTFLDFKQVLKTYATLDSTQKILGNPLRLRVSMIDGEFVFSNSLQAIVSYEDVHELAQKNSSIRGKFYQFAMSKWR